MPPRSREANTPGLATSLVPLKSEGAGNAGRIDAPADVPVLTFVCCWGGLVCECQNQRDISKIFYSSVALDLTFACDDSRQYRRECQIRHTSLACKNKKHASKSPQVRRNIPALPARMVLTACFVLFPVSGLSCHRYLWNRFHKCDASVEASEPHDFAVRVTAHSSQAPPASIAPRAQRP
jgi:hypothetical protein